MATNDKQPPVEHAWRVKYLCWILKRLRTWIRREWQDAYIAKSLKFSGKSINRELPGILMIRCKCRSRLVEFSFWVFPSFFTLHRLNYQSFVMALGSYFERRWNRLASVEFKLLACFVELKSGSMPLKLQNWNCWIAFETEARVKYIDRNYVLHSGLGFSGLGKFCEIWRTMTQIGKATEAIPISAVVPQSNLHENNCAFLAVLIELRE